MTTPAAGHVERASPVREQIRAARAARATADRLRLDPQGRGAQIHAAHASRTSLPSQVAGVVGLGADLDQRKRHHGSQKCEMPAENRHVEAVSGWPAVHSSSEASIRSGDRDNWACSVAAGTHLLALARFAARCNSILQKRSEL